MPEYTKQLTFKTLANGDVSALLVLTFPNGAKRIFQETLTTDDRHRAATSFARMEGGAIAGQACRHMIGEASDAPRKGEHPADWWWRVSEAKKLRKPVDDRKALAKWWEDIGRQRRATVKAIHAESPKGTPAQKQKWWDQLGAAKRKRARERHGGEGGGILADVVKTVKSVDRAIDKSVLGKVAQVALPMFAVGRWSFKNPEKAVAFIPGGSSAAEGAKQAVKYLPAAKKLAAGKVMEAASKSLEATGETAIGVGAAKELGVSSRLAVADAAMSLGTTGAAKQLARGAKKKLAGVSDSVARATYDLANKTRKNVAALAGDKKPAAAAAKKAAPVPSIRKAARERVLSNVKGPVSELELGRAMQAGRVFFIVKRAA